MGRVFGLCAATLLWAGCTSGPEYPESTNAILGDEVLEAIEQRIGGRLGIALIDDTGTQLRAYRGDERFAMCSTFKLPLGAAVLEEAESGRLSLEETIAFGEDDILEYAPVVSERIGDGEMTVAELAEAISTVSDNSAANLLLARIGGPEGLTAFFRSHGDEVTRLDRTEPALNENLPDDPRDTTSPVAMAGLVQRLVLGDVLEPASRAMLADWTVASTTGLHRIRAGLPEGWRAGDKTGTCWTAYNDVAIIWPSESDPFVLAIYIDRPEATPREVNAAFAEIGELAASYMSARDIN